MNDQPMPSCFGQVWDGCDDQACKGCAIEKKCKDKFIHEVVATKPKDMSDEEMAKDIGLLGLNSIREARQVLAEIMGEFEEETAAIPEKRPSKSPPLIEEDFVDVSEFPKKRRGRKPSDLIPCPQCGGKGTLDGKEPCPKCKGYGDFSPSKEEGTKEKKSGGRGRPRKTVEKGAEEEQVNLPIADGNAPTKGMGGEISSSDGGGSSVSIQGKEVPNAVHGDVGDSGKSAKSPTKGRPKKAKGANKENSSVVSGEVFSAEGFAQLLGSINTVKIKIADVSGVEISLEK